MSRQYHIVLSEKDIDKIYDTMKKDLSNFYICNKLLEAKQKPYTNFDKIKDNMTIIGLQIVYWVDIIKKYVNLHI